MKQLIVFCSLLLLASCASNREKQIYHEKMQEKPNMSKSQMNERILNLLDSSKSLSEKQREEVLALHSGVMQKVRGINDELRRLKVVLFKSLATGDYKRRKLDSIKKKIVVQYNKRLNLMFDALYKMQKILLLDQNNGYFHSGMFCLTTRVMLNK